ncbi:DUF4340 domain-containing protein [Saccharospirillum mangrovi]|uniref:DUF4340 domain-containing protein n=1 Tax=Saccharospirillum mangrovi TaxID=2161747 RepID=UPI00130026F8|nr:DUF4340 domain-containing protein [Saccharospirillum mangrovi]
MLNKFNRWLLAALAIQLVLVVAVVSGVWLRPSGADSKPLLTGSREAIQELRITDHSGDDASNITLNRHDDGWQFIVNGVVIPASTARVDTLLDGLFDAQLSWPVAHSGSAAKRFETADDNFRRQLTLVTDDGEQTLYFGTSPSYQQLHVRRADDNAVYAIDLEANQLDADGDHWLDNRLLQIEPSTLSQATLNDIELYQTDDGWVTDGSVANPNPAHWQDWLERWHSVIVSNLIDGDDADSLTATDPVLTVDFGDAGQYRLFHDGDRYALVSSLQDGLFRISNGTGEALSNIDALWQDDPDEPS